MFTPTATRVSRFDPPETREAIRRKTEQSIAYYVAHPEEIDARLVELDVEWDIERGLETGSSCLTLMGLALAIFKNRKWLLLSVAVQGFFLEHSLQGWCPPLPVLRRLGYRTQSEIDKERYALKAIRGDFRSVLDTEMDGQCKSASQAVNM